MSTFDWPPEVNGAPWDAVENPFTDHPEATDGPYRVMSAVPNALVEQLTAGTGVPGRFWINGAAQIAYEMLDVDVFLATPSTTPVGHIGYLFDGANCVVFHGNYTSGDPVVPTKITTNPAVGTVFFTDFFFCIDEVVTGPRMFVMKPGSGGILPLEVVLGQTGRLITADAIIRKGDICFIDATADDIELTIDPTPGTLGPSDDRVVQGPQEIRLHRIDFGSNTALVSGNIVGSPGGFYLDPSGAVNTGQLTLVDVGGDWYPTGPITFS